MHRIVLKELDSEGVPLDCDADIAAVISEFGLVTLEPARVGFTVKPRGRVGAIRVGDLQIEVTPKDKVGIASVFFLLGYAAKPGFIPPDVITEHDDDMFAAIAEALTRQAERALAGGVHRGYVSVDEASRTVRGRIRMSDQALRHFGSMYPIEVTYDDFSPDVAENRILLTALRAVTRIPRMRRELLARIAGLEVFLDGVGPLGRGEALPRWVPTRLNERYHGALHLAELVLKHQSLRPGPAARYDAAGFVVDMAKVFEDFVGTALREALASHPGVVQTQYKTRLDENLLGVSPVTLIPDVVLTLDGRPLMVADAKYKAASSSGDYPNADKYQMLAYCTALGLPRAWLVYAQGGEPITRRIVSSDVEITEWPLDLSMAPSEILARVSDLATAATYFEPPWLSGAASPSLSSV